MSRVVTLCLLLAGVSGCAGMGAGYASDYCRIDQGTPCSQLAGDGFCQPCPEAGFRQAQGEVPTDR